MAVHGFAITVGNAATGAHLDHTSFLTKHRVTAEHVAGVAQAGRGRWKIDKAHNHGLKTTGDHVAHNVGPGQPDLAAVMRSLNLLAFVFHPVLEWSEDTEALLRQVLARRQTFFNDIQAFMRSLVFDRWDHLMDVMIRGLALASQGDTS